MAFDTIIEYFLHDLSSSKLMLWSFRPRWYVAMSRVPTSKSQWVWVPEVQQEIHTGEAREEQKYLSQGHFPLEAS